jgi:nucleoside-diphosphate-sugar epimerase
MRTKVLVIGSTGFVGSTIAGLLSNHYEVVCTARQESSFFRLDAIRDNIELIIGAEDKILNLISGGGFLAVVNSSVCYGLASHPCETINTNTFFPIRAAQSAMDEGVPLFVHIDTFFRNLTKP